METHCRPGDLAVIVKAEYRCNLGRIVTVVAEHDGTGDIVFRGAGVVWLVASSQPIKWTVGKKLFRRKRGPVPDTYLKPIRGNPVCSDVLTDQQSCESPVEDEKLDTVT